MWKTVRSRGTEESIMLTPKSEYERAKHSAGALHGWAQLNPVVWYHQTASPPTSFSLTAGTCGDRNSERYRLGNMDRGGTRNWEP
jgi:hypothetical protein